MAFREEQPVQHLPSVMIFRTSFMNEKEFEELLRFSNITAFLSI
jgi:hypothetical protein